MAAFDATRYRNLFDAMKPVPIQPGRTFVPLKKVEVQTDIFGEFWWNIEERFVDRTYYPGPYPMKYALYTLCMFVLDEDDYLYITLRVSEYTTRVVARSRTWLEAERAHLNYHFFILDNPHEFGFTFEDIHWSNLDRVRPVPETS